MTYIDGFVAAMPQQNKQAYLDHVREASSLFNDHGATRMVENWGDDVPMGEVTDSALAAGSADRQVCAVQVSADIR
jgi:uncharacterized protein YbaA (DUF1428 family)